MNPPRLGGARRCAPRRAGGSLRAVPDRFGCTPGQVRTAIARLAGCAEVTGGTVGMTLNDALRGSETRGFVLTCQSRPTTDRLARDSDAA